MSTLIVTPERELERLVKVLAHYRRRPVRFIEDFFGVKPDVWQADVLEAKVEAPLVAVRSGHGPGKSSALAWAIIHEVATGGWNTKVPCTAPTYSQLYDVLWAEISKWLTGSPLSALLETTATRLFWKGHPEDCFAVARSARKTIGKQSNLAGFHARNLLYVVDEASGVDEGDFEVILGALSNEGARCMLAGNPSSITGTFYDAFHRDSRLWKRFHVCAPVPMAERPAGAIISNRVSAEYVVRMREKYGKDSPIYQVRVLGEFPTYMEGAIIPLAWISRALEAKLTVNPSDPRVWGIDWSGGGEGETVIVDVQGDVVLNVYGWHGDPMENVGRVAAHYLTSFDDGEAPSVIRTDHNGLGVYADGRLREVLDDEAARRGSIKPTLIPVSQETGVSEPEIYARIGDELWGLLANRFREGRIDLSRVARDDVLIAQLASRKWAKPDSKGRLVIEDKKTLKAQGQVSPDRADALCLALYNRSAGGQNEALLAYLRRRGHKV